MRFTKNGRQAYDARGCKGGGIFRLGTQCEGGQRNRGFQQLGCAQKPHAKAGRIGHLGAVFACGGGGDKYKFHVTQCDGRVVDKTDPYGVYAEVRPNNASVLYPLERYNGRIAAG